MRLKEQCWFPHDCDTRNILEVAAFTNKHGLLGYGFWWAIIEILRAEDDYKLDVNNPFLFSSLSHKLGIKEAKLKILLSDMLEYFCILQTDGDFIWCEYLNGRMEFLEERRKTLSENGKKGARARWGAKDEQGDSRV